ncbi:MAG: hypothetical protein FWG03_10085, partial [Clostridiales bacterium]|nr:hypothetical protein [Clostridiales bacterium]
MAIAVATALLTYNFTGDAGWCGFLGGKPGQMQGQAEGQGDGPEGDDVVPGPPSVVVQDDVPGGGGATGDEVAFVMVTEITGFIGSDGEFDADPWYTYKLPESPAAAILSGEYSVRIYGSDGQRLSITYFDLEQNFHVFTEYVGVALSDSRTPISFAVVLPEGAAKIALHRGDEELYTREINEKAPSVSLKGLTEGQDIQEKTTLSWDASGEGDLFFQIWYYPREDEFFKVATDITGNSCSIDLSDCPGSNEGFFRILCTDGVNTAVDESVRFKVPFMAPIIVTDNRETLRFKVTEEVFFRVNIYDKQDGALLGRYTLDEQTGVWNPDTNVEWLIDGEPFYCYGDVLFAFPYKVPPGLHTFTLVARNSAGLEASKDFQVEIIDDESDLPDDWSRAEIRDALLLGFSVPLDRIDAPINRGLYARFMGYVFTDFSNWPGGNPDIKDTDTPQYTGNDYDEAFMVWSGLMDVAEDGSFDAHKSMTERDGALIMFKTLLMANDPSATNDGL